VKRRYRDHSAPVASALRRARNTRDNRRAPVAEHAAVVIRIGTSGLSYDHWAPELYAPGHPAGDRLVRYAAAFATAEVLPLAPAIGVRQLASSLATRMGTS
jgi:hypothetical protein